MTGGTNSLFTAVDRGSWLTMVALDEGTLGAVTAVDLNCGISLECA